MDEKTTGGLTLQVGIDFTFMGVAFSGAYRRVQAKGSEAGKDIVAGCARDIRLRRFLGDWCPDLRLSELSLVYDVTDETYAYQAVLGNRLDLADLPFIGRMLPVDRHLAIERLRIQGDDEDLRLAADIVLDGQILAPAPILRIAEKPSKASVRGGEADRPGGPTTAWTPVKKGFGPINITRIGMNYDMKRGKVFFHVDASLAMGPITVGLAGLRAGSPIATFAPEFGLDGLSIAYSQGGILISGALLYDPSEDSFTGCAVIQTPVISIPAIGGYQRLDGEPCLFIFAALNKSSGLVCLCLGPVFLQITGICAGFGYNRLLHVPGVDTLKEFPLVSIASGGTDVGRHPLEIVRQVKTYIPVAKGEMFFAFGVTFSIQRLIDCQALLVVRAGAKTRIDILGLAKISLPSAVDSPIARIEMAYKISLDPGEGVVSVQAALTPASYLFTPQCRLTGGFAFFSWFSGPHAGDFVLSIGGYHPNYTAPAHYPRVPRVGFQWQVASYFAMKGAMYCALTPSALMFGGRLQVLFDYSCSVGFDIGICGTSLGGTIHASFDMVFNILISWKPFYYSADISVAIGIEVKFRGSVKFLFFRATVELGFSLHLGARLQIWGPEFAGIAHVDWSVISFDIAFGKQKKAPPPKLSFEQFRESFLAAPSGICTLSITSGLIKESEIHFTAGDGGGKTGYVVNPCGLRLTAVSLIPALRLWVGREKSIPREEGKTFGIVSMDTRQVDTSDLFLTIERHAANERQADETRKFDVTRIDKRVAAAVWGEEKPTLDAEAMLDGMLMGVELIPAATQQETAQEKRIDYNRDTPATRSAWADKTRFSPLPMDDADDVDISRKRERRDAIIAAFGLDPRSISLDPGRPYIPVDRLRVGVYS